MSAAATVNAIHEQGGLAVAAHPFWRTGRQVRSGPVHGVGWLAAELDFDAVEVENATPGFYVFNRLARRLNLGPSLVCDALAGDRGRDDPDGRRPRTAPRGCPELCWFSVKWRTGVPR